MEVPPPKKTVNAADIRKYMEKMQPWKKQHTVGFASSTKPAEENKVEQEQLPPKIEEPFKPLPTREAKEVRVTTSTRNI